MLCNKPATIAVNSACSSVNCWHIP